MKDCETKDHESYGMLSFSRVSSSGGVPLFGSSIQHKEFIKMRVNTATVDRHLNRNWYHPQKSIVEVEMSYTQFVEAISSMNSSGVPVTIRYVQGKQMEPCPFENMRDTLVKEFQKEVDEVLLNAAKAAKLAEERLKATGPISKQERLEIAGILYKIEQDLRSNLKFVLKSFNEQTEQTVQEAKGEIESFFSSKIHALGSAVLVEHLENGILQAPQIEYEEE